MMIYCITFTIHLVLTDGILDVDRRPLVLRGAVEEGGSNVSSTREVEEVTSSVLSDGDGVAIDAVVVLRGTVDEICKSLIVVVYGDVLIGVVSHGVGVVGIESRAWEDVSPSGGVADVESGRPARGKVRLRWRRTQHQRD